jgi:hypothetical protein
MQGLATKDSRLGTKLRKRERSLRHGPVLRPSLPPEFSDPDLNEGWEAADGEKCSNKCTENRTGADRSTQSTGASPRHNFHSENITATRSLSCNRLSLECRNKESSKGLRACGRGHKEGDSYRVNSIIIIR